jgi:hypothetical protein
MEPNDHSDLVCSATSAGQPAGHRSHASDVSPYGGSVMHASNVCPPRRGSTSSMRPHHRVTQSSWK